MQRAGLRTSDGTDLTVGSIAALDYLRRVGTAIVGVATTIASVLRETSGPTDLTIGSVADGEFLKRSGSTIVGGTAGSSHGTATIDFGTTYADTGEVVVTGQNWVTASSDIQAWMQGDDSTADSSAPEHEFLATMTKLIVTDRVAGVGFTIRAFLFPGYAQGDFLVHWEGS